MTTFEPMPEISVTYSNSPLRPGGMSFPIAKYDAYRHLKLVLYNHPRGRALAQEHELVLDPYTLYVPEALTLAFWAWRLACWRDPVLHKFFDATGLAVYEGVTT
jgi:hypothetical protein